jgi:5-methylcytosine-specific restriction protein A
MSAIRDEVTTALSWLLAAPLSDDARDRALDAAERRWRPTNAEWAEARANQLEKVTVSDGWRTRRPTGTGPSPYTTAAWKKLRLQVLARDGHICQVRGPGCTPNLAVPGRATVDHIRPLALGGAQFDPANLRAACRRCNAWLGAKLGRRRQGRGRPTEPSSPGVWIV